MPSLFPHLPHISPSLPHLSILVVTSSRIPRARGIVPRLQEGHVVGRQFEVVDGCVLVDAGIGDGFGEGDETLFWGIEVRGEVR